MNDIFENDIFENSIMHYGMPRRSGRYPWGSGENPYQHSGDFLSRVEELKSKGLSEKEIAKDIGLTTTQLRTQLSLAKEERRALLVDRAEGLRKKGYTLDQIAAEMGFKNDSSVRSLLNENTKARMNQAKVTADYLKEMVDKKGMIDVGTGVERELGISAEKLKEALYILELQGYNTYGGGLPQVTNSGRQTNLKILCPPGTEHKEIYEIEKINSVKDYDKVLTEDGTKVRKAFEYPASMDINRLKIRYAEDGGIDKDGLMEIRRNVPDLDLGDATYAQVRILVDGDRYLKGMAVYSDDLPDGVDVVFNTNKTKDKAPRDVLKKISDDPDNPFGSLIKEHGGQSYYDDPNGKYTDPVTGKKQSLSLINKRAEEGDWMDWKDKLSAQFLAKQSETLIKKQLGLTKADADAEFDEIKSLTNPVIKKKLLWDFAETCDAKAVDLKAAALPRQKYQVLIPLTTIKDNEVYAPNYNNGEKIALIRYPHGGTFEIPILTVNNKLPEGKKYLGTTPKDAIGINKNVADRLSGADFDGDTAMCIPLSNKVKITSTDPLPGLKGFDPKMEYPEKPGMKIMKNTQIEMGIVSNLITDMTIKGAGPEDLTKAVRHSMVVIDAEKHRLNYKQSEKDNDIAALKRKYQGSVDENGKYHEGASTLISKAKSQQSVVKRKGSPSINEDGTLSWKTVDDPTYVNKKGKTIVRTQKSTKMAEVKDAIALISEYDSVQERLYADYANHMKGLANAARREILATGNIDYKPSAKKAYKEQVDSLDAKLDIALRNAPKERRAQTIANSVVNAKKRDNPDLTKQEIKKISQQELTKARTQVGAKRENIVISDKEWEAIQAGAVSSNKLSQIMNHTDTDRLRELATPREKTSLSNAKIGKITQMSNSGYTLAEIAKAVGVSTSTVSKYLS